MQRWKDKATQPSALWKDCLALPQARASVQNKQEHAKRDVSSDFFNTS